MAILIERKLRRRRRKEEEDIEIIQTTTESKQPSFVTNVLHQNSHSNSSNLLHNNNQITSDDFAIFRKRDMYFLEEEEEKQQDNFTTINNFEKCPQNGCCTRRQHCKVRRGDRRNCHHICWPNSVSAIDRKQSPLTLLLLLVSITLIATSSLNLMNFINHVDATNSINNALNGQQQSQQQISSYLQQQLSNVGGSSSVIMAPPTSQKPRYKTMYACEDRQLTMDCDYGYKINLIRANFGRFSIATCNEQGLLDLSTDCKSPITFRIMTERCQDKQKCSVNATSALFGDKCPKTRKYLEVHFQCVLDARPSPTLPSSYSNEPPERVDLRNSTQYNNNTGSQVYSSVGSTVGSGASAVLPPNNPPFSSNLPQQIRPAMMPDELMPQAPLFQQNPPRYPNPQQMAPLPQQPMTVMNSEILSYNVIADSRSFYKQNTSSSDLNSRINNDPIVVTLRHTHIENMSNPRCVLWDSAANQWTDKGSRIVETNFTHTTCAFDQATSYLLVMDYLAPYPTISQLNPSYYPSSPQPIIPPISQAPPENILEFQPVPIDPSIKSINQQERQSTNTSSSSKFLSLFGYLIAAVFVAVAVLMFFIASKMRSSAGAALKSLGNFTAFNGPKYKARRADGTLHNKDLLVINNQNGHQFLYAPANTTKINSSSSTHILSGGVGHQGTLHQIQQQPQMYSGNGTLSNLSGTGGQSNNYYYGLMGLTNLFQHPQQQSQQLQQHHMSQHHLNQQQQQLNQTSQASYLHQANKSTISTESANSSPSSSGVESGSTSINQQQQQQSCLVMNNDYNLIGHLANYDNQAQQLNNMPGANQPTLTLNAHYSSSGLTPMNMFQNRINSQHQNNNLNREQHIYECVDDDKTYTARLLVASNVNLSEQLNSNTLNQHHQNAMLINNHQNSRAMTLSSRLSHNNGIINQQQSNQMQQQQQQQSNQQSNNKRLFSHPAIIRDNQAKTNIICSKIAQVTPMRATEINKYQHDVMAIYNGHDATTATATNSSSSGNSSACYGRTDSGAFTDGLKLSTDC